MRPFCSPCAPASKSCESVHDDVDTYPGTCTCSLSGILLCSGDGPLLRNVTCIAEAIVVTAGFIERGRGEPQPGLFTNPNPFVVLVLTQVALDCFLRCNDKKMCLSTPAWDCFICQISRGSEPGIAPRRHPDAVDPSNPSIRVPICFFQS